MKLLRLNYLDGGDWRSPRDRAYLSSAAWKRLRLQVLERDDYTCVYCGHRQPRGMEVNHTAGYRDEALESLETVCPLCHRVLHAGLFAAIHGSLLIFGRAACDQNEIMRRTWQARQEEHLPDRPLMERLGLAEPRAFRMDRPYLAGLYGYVVERYGLLEEAGRRSRR
ncbi:MAG: hypothetical protein NVSMB65_14190 [Chloroflexota bacterium]